MSAADLLLGLRVWIPPVAWMSVCCECCVLSGRGLCDGLITRPEESYRLWCVIVCDLEISRVRRRWPTLGCFPENNINNKCTVILTKYNIVYTDCNICLYLITQRRWAILKYKSFCLHLNAFVRTNGQDVLKRRSTVPACFSREYPTRWWGSPVLRCLLI
jgi:hypothetical protein